MRTPSYNEALLELVKQKLPREISLAAFLMNVLCIGREAAYRRLRGEVLLTLEEAARLSKALDISIDTILGSGKERMSSYRMCMTEFIPLTLASPEGLLLPPVFSVVTGLPVIIISYLLAYSISNVGKFYNNMKSFEKWFRRIVASIFIVVGIYYIIINI